MAARAPRKNGARRPAGAAARSVEVPVTRLPGSEGVAVPQYMTAGASGADIHAAVPRRVVLEPGEVRLIPTGLTLAVPRGYEAQVRARSGLALRHGIMVVNAPGTIDSDYRGEVGVILANLGRGPFAIERGDRIAQLVIAPVARARWTEVSSLRATDRSSGGFGHTGTRPRGRDGARRNVRGK